ncbi:MAG: dockerin type I domain-containing protein [Oscillospiraceae bacterium]|nr:dockerin type I domain-containing protein [Oscillospiraceae bacterium]
MDKDRIKCRWISRRLLSIILVMCTIAALITGPIAIAINLNENEYTNDAFETVGNIDFPEFDEWKSSMFELPNNSMGLSKLVGIAPSSQGIEMMSTSFTPQYSSNGKFLAEIIPIEDLPDFSEYIAISDRAGLEAINNNLSGKYYLTNDIDLSGAEWVPIGYGSNNAFSGIFDGQGFVINNLKNTVATYSAGLFEHMKNATISNVGLEGTNIVSEFLAGGISGHTSGLVHISNCYNTGDISGQWAGGIVGFGTNSISFSHCYNNGSVSSILSSSTSSISFPLEARAGGICGIFNTNSSIDLFYIDDCYNTGDILASSSTSSTTNAIAYAGGIVGHISNSLSTQQGINDCYNIGNISATSNALVYTSEAFAGGIIGKLNGITTVNCYNEGSVVASSFGQSETYSAIAYAGGISGQIENSTETVICYNKGTVIAISMSNANAGGICGSGNNSFVSECFNIGEVVAKPTPVSMSTVAIAGGICGKSFYTQIINCFNTGFISTLSTSASTFIGGICGDTNSSVSNCYNIGDIDAKSNATIVIYFGSIVGRGVNIHNCYWRIESNQSGNGIQRSNSEKRANGSSNDITTGRLTDEQMKDFVNYVDFDYPNVWGSEYFLNNSYPFLQMIPPKMDTIVNYQQLVDAIYYFNNHALVDTTIIIGEDIDVLERLQITNQNQKLWIISDNIQHTLKVHSNYSDDGYVSGGFEIRYDAYLVIETIILEGIIIPPYNYNSILVDIKGGTFIMNNNVILRNGSGVRVDAGGTFIMNGGMISDNQSEGVCVYSPDSTFLMTNGTICNNKTTYWGGGVNIESGSFIMYGGSIHNNIAPLGGGVCVNNGKFIMYGGEIRNNIASVLGGGVCSGDRFVMYDGIISENISNGQYQYPLSGGGGGVYYTGTFIMNGGVISDNNANGGYGGGIYQRGNTLSINNGIISGNTAVFGGGILSYGEVNISSGTIIDNTATIDGGAMYLIGNSSSFVMYSGIISNNHAINNGGGVYGNGSIILGGTTVIKNNTRTINEIANNVHLGSNQYITVGTGLDGNGVLEPESNMEIWVTTEIENGLIINFGATEYMTSLFFSDENNMNVDYEKNQLFIPKPLNIMTSMLSNGTIGIDYNQTLIANGSAPITWSVESGTIPEGLIFSTDGLISGTPIKSGLFEFTVKAENSISYNTQVYTITVVQADENDITASFTDPVFLAYVRQITNKPTGPIFNYDVESILSVNVQSRNISSLSGIEHFVALTILGCGNNLLTELDVSNNVALIELYCDRNLLASLDVSKNTTLTNLDCRSNQLTELDVSHNTNLINLNCDSNLLKELDVSSNVNLKYLGCGSNKLTDLDVVNNYALLYLYCGNNKLMELDVLSNIVLTDLLCHNNQLTELDVSQNTALTYLHCNNNQITELDISNNIALMYFNCESNQLTELDLSNNATLSMLYCGNNLLTELDLSYYSITMHMLVDCTKNILASTDDVIGWEDRGLILNNSFHFYPQNSTSVPTAPKSFLATPCDGQVTLTWSIPAREGINAITGYQVSKDNGATWEAATDNASHIFLDLTNGERYTFKVRAVSIAGYGIEATKRATPIAGSGDIDTIIISYIPLSAINLSTNENIVTLSNLIASKILPVHVTVTDGMTYAQANIISWIGSFNGEVIGAKMLTAIWEAPVGFIKGSNPITITILINIEEVQTLAAIPISNRSELEKIGNDPAFPLDGDYYMTSSIDFSGTEWIPIGSYDNPFIGVFDGQGNIINNLTISGEVDYAGLFGVAQDATIRNIKLENTNISINGYYAGGVCGFAMYNTTISNCYNTGSVSVSLYNPHVSSMFVYAGGICGSAGTNVILSNCFNTSTVSASSDGNCTAYAGGLCATSFHSIINNCYNTGTVSSSATTAYTSAITGGICGWASNESTLINCYNIGTVISSHEFVNNSGIAGGICGFSDINIIISRSYWRLESDQIIDGTVRQNHEKRYIGNIEFSTEYLLTDAKMRQRSSFEGFNFDSIWGFIRSEYDYPVLRAFIDVNENSATIYGRVSSYNPKNEITIVLYKAGSASNVIISTTIAAQVTESSLVTQEFVLVDIPEGVYDLVVSKGGHLSYMITNVIVGGVDIDLSTNSDKEYSTINLLSGDINNDGIINASDLNLFIASFGSSPPTNALADINGDNVVNASDLNIFISNFGRRNIEIEY